MKLLLHTCCGPCSVSVIKKLREEGIEPTIYWYNPNIHPYMEYKNRKETLEKYAKEINAKIILEDEYGLRNFCKNVITNLNDRCVNYCYIVRLEQTAKYAKENGYDSFSTTLLVSPYQNHDKIIEISNKLAKKYDLKFVYYDFRENFREGQKEAREKGMYMQKYCGCVFSEEDRYLRTKK